MPDSSAGRTRTIAARQFVGPNRDIEVRPLGHGNINDTFLVTCADPADAPFILQRLNPSVFAQPIDILKNIRVYGEHVSQRLATCPLTAGRRWEVVAVLNTRDGLDHWCDGGGGFWRALTFVEQTRSVDRLTDMAQAAEVGYALGTFHRLVSDLPVNRLTDTLPGFHVTPLYLHHYDEILARVQVVKSPEVAHCLRFIEARRDSVGILEEARAAGRLVLRPIHGDPKVNNVLFDERSGQAVALVDLDTIKPGLIHYDLGDCLRSACNPAGEEARDWEAVCFEPDLAQGVLQGYLAQTGGFLKEADLVLVPAALRLIAFELGLRFFSDYLAGDLYFKADYPEHNLLRALVQFQLTVSVESRLAMVEALVRE